MKNLIAITDARYSDSEMLLCVPRLAERWGSRLSVQVRTGFADAEALITLCRTLGIQVWFNRDLERALHYRAGFHGSPHEVDAARRAGVEGPCSVPVHSLAELEAASRADTILISPVFAVAGKRDPLGLDGLRALAARAGGTQQVIALGGVDGKTCMDVLAVPGVAGVAAIRSAWNGALQLG